MLLHIIRFFSILAQTNKLGAGLLDYSKGQMPQMQKRFSVV